MDNENKNSIYYHLPEPFKFEYVPAVGCYCLFNNNRLIYKDYSFTVTFEDLKRMIINNITDAKT